MNDERHIALSKAPASMTLIDEALWNEAYKNNSKDPYGMAVIKFCEAWARLMEAEVAKGKTIAECADKASSLADNEGITGFMYGCAVSILSKVWIHGEDLRRWSNRRLQIGNEGDKANDKPGAVLNPALLCIG
jgi:hypothetical protein